MTEATWMRQFVQGHPKYNHDSIINNEIALDLMTACDEIGTGIRPCPEILGSIRFDRIRKEDAYGRPLHGRLHSMERAELIQRLMNRASLPGRPLARTNSVSGDPEVSHSPTPSAAFSHTSTK